MSNSIKLLIGNVALLIAYYISAHITLSLSLPPTDGTPIWIPSGISLAAVLIWGYRLLPAIFLGDFIIAIELMGLGDSHSILTCLLIGAQAAGAVWFTVYLLYKWHLWPNLLIEYNKIIQFFLTCAFAVFSTTLIFVTCEFSLGIIELDQLLSALFLWWSGGLIGIVIFTPLTLIIFAQPRFDWSARISNVGLPLLIVFLCVIAGLFVVKDRDKQQQDIDFYSYVSRVHSALEVELSKNELMLRGMRAYFQNTPDVSLQQFNGYLRDLSEQQSHIGGIGWVDYVVHEQRSVYENKHREQIVELTEYGSKQRAHDREDYFVMRYVQYISALKNRNNIEMLDMCVGESRAQLCQNLLKSKVMSILPSLKEYHGKEKRFVLALPVLSAKQDVIGAVGHMYEYYSLFNTIKLTPERKWVEFVVRDISESIRSPILFDSGIGSKSSELTLTKTIKIGGRTWLLEYQPSIPFIEDRVRWSLYWGISIALIIVSLLSIFLLAMTGRIRQIKQEVDTQTAIIQKGEEKFRRLVEGVKDEYLLYFHGKDGIFSYISPSIEAILGYSQEEFLQHYSTYLPETQLNQHVDKYTRSVLEEGVTAKYELEILHKNGEIHTFKILEYPSIDSDGAVIGVEGIAQDITKYKQKERELEKLSLAVECSPNAVIITDGKGVIEYINPKITEITGYSLQDAIGEQCSLLKSGTTPNDVYKELWETILSGNTWQGELQNRKKNGDLFWSLEQISPMINEYGEIIHFIATMTDITSQKEEKEEISYQASHDLLTGLINRREFEKRLERVLKSAQDEGSKHALCFMDLDQFKIINDTCGHVAGDELLRQVGDLMLSKVRQRDTLARLGGDEFALLMEHCEVRQAQDTSQKLIDTLADFRFHWEEHVFTIGISIGLASIDHNIQSCDEILSYVDSACYAAKDAGRNRVETHIEGSERLKLRQGEVHWSREISDALEYDRFELFCQPIASLKNLERHNCNYEILLRLRMKDDSIVLPSTFLPAAERYNLSVRIDRWVIEHTLRWLSRHKNELKHLHRISINLSAQSLADEAMLGFIFKEFQGNDVLAEQIEFEITETVAIANLREATVFINALSEFGCKFALDNFGSGLSSFAYLKNLKVDVLKINGAFVKDILDDPLDFEMIRSINDIGHVMGLEIVAECVESGEIADKLRDIGVDYAQGSALGVPVPIDDII